MDERGRRLLARTAKDEVPLTPPRHRIPSPKVTPSPHVPGTQTAYLTPGLRLPQIPVTPAFATPGQQFPELPASPAFATPTLRPARLGSAAVGVPQTPALSPQQSPFAARPSLSFSTKEQSPPLSSPKPTPSFTRGQPPFAFSPNPNVGGSPQHEQVADQNLQLLEDKLQRRQSVVMQQGKEIHRLESKADEREKWFAKEVAKHHTEWQEQLAAAWDSKMQETQEKFEAQWAAKEERLVAEIDSLRSQLGAAESELLNSQSIIPPSKDPLFDVIKASFQQQAIIPSTTSNFFESNNSSVPPENSPSSNHSLSSTTLKFAPACTGAIPVT